MKLRTPAEMLSSTEEKQRLTNTAEETTTASRNNPEVIVYQPSGKIEERKDSVHLTIPEGHGLRKSLSMTSIASKVRRNRERFKNNQCAGIILFLILGSLCNILSYLASVWSAQLNAELIQTAVTNEHTLKFKLKKTIIDFVYSEVPSICSELPNRTLLYGLEEANRTNPLQLLIRMRT